jgi:hypothetical protein
MSAVVSLATARWPRPGTRCRSMRLFVSRLVVAAQPGDAAPAHWVSSSATVPAPMRPHMATCRNSRSCAVAKRREQRTVLVAHRSLPFSGSTPWYMRSSQLSVPRWRTDPVAFLMLQSAGAPGSAPPWGGPATVVGLRARASTGPCAVPNPGAHGAWPQCAHRPQGSFGAGMTTALSSNRPTRPAPKAT